MPQARLPDINTQYIKFTNEAVNGWKSENYEACLGSLYSLNALLPEKYRVELSDELYKARTAEKILNICTECNKEIEHEKIETYQIMLPFVQSVLNKTLYKEVWKCPKCQVENDLLTSKIVIDKPKDPEFFKVVPNPPRLQDGILDGRKYHSKFTVWFWTCLGEIQAQMAQFRDDNWTKETPFSEIDYDGSLENAD